AFVTNVTEQSLSGNFKWIKLNTASSKLVVIGNFDVVPQSGSVTFPVAGTWYDYFNENTITATGASQSFFLQPGEYRVFTNVNAALPVNLLRFEGAKKENTNVLMWEVATELNVDFYEIEKSLDGSNFASIGKINAVAHSQYQYTDHTTSAAAGVEYYRLKIVDINGQANYSTIVTIKSNNASWSIAPQPNPFINELKLWIESPVMEKATLVITDPGGRLLVQKNISVNSGKNSIQINETSGLSKGTYFLTIISSAGKQTIKVIKSN